MSKITENTTNLQEILDTVNGLPEGGNSGGVEYEVITIPVGATSATYTLSRVTGAYGTTSLYGENMTHSFSNEFRYDTVPILHISNGSVSVISYFAGQIIYNGGCTIDLEFDTGQVNYNNGIITWNYGTVDYPITLTLINDPNADEL